MAINRRNSKWCVDWWVSGRRYYKFFDRQHDARDFAAKVRNDKRLGQHVAPDRIPTFKEAAETWLTTRSDRTEASYDRYATRLRCHLIPRFGAKRLDQITTAEIETWRAGLRLAPNTIRALSGTLRSIFDSAVRGNRLASNPCDRLERSYNRAKEEHREGVAIRPDEILSSDEIRQLLDAAEPGLHKTLFMLAASTGAREGELLALRWSDVIFDGQPHIEIRRSLSWAKGPLGEKEVHRIGPPKTKAGVRDVSIIAPMVLVLKRWKLEAGRNELDLVFAEPDGTPIHRTLMLRHGFWPALKRAGLRHVKFHTLRHSHASGLIAAGAPVSEVQHRLGHSNSAITLNTYTHWLKTADSGAADAYSATLFGG